MILTILAIFGGVLLLILAVAYYGTQHVATLDVKGKHVVITGASEGLGLSLAAQLAAKGAHVTLISRSQEKLKAALATVSQKKQEEDIITEISKIAAGGEAERLVGQSQRVTTFAVDVADRLKVKDAIDKAAQLNQNRVDVLISCAGFCRPGRVDETDPAWFSKHLDVNYLGHVHSALAALPYMKAQRSGRIVGVLSVLGLNTLPGYAAYSGAKYAARGFYESLSWEVAPYGISVSIGVPGTILSPGYEEENKTKPPETVEAEADSPRQTPDQVAAKFVHDIEHWKAYISPSGLDTDASVMLCSGLSMVSFPEVLMQIFGASLMRFGALLLHVVKVRSINAKHVAAHLSTKKTQ